MSNIAQLKQRVVYAEERCEYLQSLVDSFFAGESCDGGTLDHAVLAQWGRKRIAEKQSNRRAVLLRAAGQQ